MQNYFFSEYGLPKKIMSDAGGNFISDKFKRLCHSMNIKQAVSSSYCHNSNGQVEVYFKFIKHTIKKCIDTKSDIPIALLQITLTPLGPGLPSPAMLLFSDPRRGIMPITNRPQINSNDNNDHFENLVKR